MLLSEAKEILKKNGYRLVEAKVPTTCTLKFSKFDLEDSMENLDELGKYGDIDDGETLYYTFVDNISIDRAKYWYENAYKDNEENWNYALLSITAEGPRGTRIQILGGDGGPKTPDWTGGVKEKEIRYVILAINEKGLRIEHYRKAKVVLNNIGTDVFEYPEDRLICASVPMKGLKQTIAKLKVDYPIFAKRIKVFNDANLSKDITDKYI